MGEERFEQEVLQRLTRIETRQESFMQRVTDLEDSAKWINRLFLGGIIGAYIGVLTTYFKN